VSDPNSVEQIKKNAAIHKTMNHLLIVKYFPTPLNHCPAITTEVGKKGSFVNHLSNSTNPDFSLFKCRTKIVKIVAQIVLAMWCVHSQCVIHGDLTPENILLDWNWKIRIVHFGRSTFTDAVNDSDANPRVDTHYLAPKRYDRIIVSENDIFLFG
jgi:serine/threonine protein kinase